MANKHAVKKAKVMLSAALQNYGVISAPHMGCNVAALMSPPSSMAWMAAVLAPTTAGMVFPHQVPRY